MIETPNLTNSPPSNVSSTRKVSLDPFATIFSVVRWRFLTSWSQVALLKEISRSETLELNHLFAEPENADRCFYQRICSESVIGHEATGAPLPNGMFEAAWTWISAYAFSDPVQVEAHFDTSSPLKNRTMLLCIKAFGLKFLGAVRVTEVERVQNNLITRYGFRYDTLQGHPENGAEWFLLEKHHESGELKFRIASAVRTGAFPNWWTRLGYEWIGKLYRDRWHIQSYRRLQKHLGSRTDVDVHISNNHCTIGFEAKLRSAESDSSPYDLVSPKLGANSISSSNVEGGSFATRS